jgi:acyl-CoA synthetase (AMP-forming)/AMP-acid ligase II
VDETGKSLPPDCAGVVHIRSPFMFSGYFRREELGGSLFDPDGFYDTGDLGYLDSEGHVYITGRQKDLIVVGGRNIYPQDVEQLAGEVAGVYPGRIVCFGVTIRDMGTQGLVILVESQEPEPAWEEIARQVRLIVPTRLDLDVFDVRVQPHGVLRKSTSGKLARQGNREWYLTGRFGDLSDAVLNELDRE